MGKLVCDGTEYSCPFCTSKLKVSVTSSTTKAQKKKVANMGNSFFPPPGGQCTICPSAPVPCTPAANAAYPGQTKVHVDGLVALGKGSIFQCAKGGILTVANPGQEQVSHS